ncbi:hypothetical protein GGTG_05538 [Gaeumannomyces tritici R3-111a-1]|uniref:DUF7702 domain-containing protein n=1 Tax=Gaeumannomyces tritici (strain R3-111a-1) TaxID=644352 RepID=J3NW73_GAET3|nr:hypothetical protein GGTG_05538 [Gaeumannomyces tritici R3-111a-1]EJT75605.1 hypothetical protein GGTG_05538 [Gaeumannomyces tritici R3-111a-1]
MRRPFGYRDAISVLQVAAFTIYLGVAFVVLCTRRSGWWSLLVFSLLRLVGAALMLATFERNSRDVWAGVLVCESLCIAQMTVLLKTLLARLNRFACVLPTWGFVLPEALAFGGIGLATAGFVYAEDWPDPLAPNPIAQSAVVFFTALYLYTVGLFVRLWVARDDKVPPAERPALLCFAILMPFMLARISYSLVFVITGDERFNAVLGDPTVYLFLVAANEVGMVAGWSTTTLKLGKLPFKMNAYGIAVPDIRIGRHEERDIPPSPDLPSQESAPQKGAGEASAKS